MAGKEKMLSLDEAEERTRKAVEELVRLIDRFNDEPEKNNQVRQTRQEDLTSLFMSLLAETYGIANLSYAGSDREAR